MTKNYLIRAGKNPFLAASAIETLNSNLTMTNVGNLLFQHAFIRSIHSADTNIITVQDQVMPDETLDKINKNIDAVYLPFANAFRPTFRGGLHNWIQMIDKIKVPVVVVGIGAQCETDNAMVELASINDDVRLFCNKVLSKSQSIGVRGEFTANYLNELGIKNVDIVGCPSMFYHGKHLPQAALPLPGNLGKIAFNFSPQSPANLGALNTHVDHELSEIRGLMQRLPQTAFDYFAQDTNELAHQIWGSKHVTLSSVCPALAHIRTRYPVDVHQWINDLQAYDLSIGTRIHGCIAAVLAGIPSVMLCHDSRTRELAQWFDLPRLDKTDGAYSLTVDRIAECLQASKMQAVFQDRYQTYVGFLKKNKIAHHLEQSTGGQAAFASYDEKIKLAKFPATLDNQPGNFDLLNEKINYLYQAMAKQR
jgi:hypothetical protein